MENKERKRLLADGPIMICEYNPKAAERFSERVCETCNGPILTHWLINFEDQDRRTTYWCTPDATQASTGMKI